MTIQTLQRGPVTPDGRVEPVPHVVPRMASPIQVSPPRVWRVNEGDFGETIDWLLPVLLKDYPKMLATGTVSWLRAVMNDRTQLFVRTRNIVGVFASEPSVFDTINTIVREKFVRSREPSNDEAVLLYRYARDWAVSIRAGKMIINVDSDAGMTNSAGVVPGLSDIVKGFTVKKHSIYAVFLTG